MAPEVEQTNASEAPERSDAETARLHAFTLRLAERLFLAAECLARCAERKTTKEAG
jgi:hypothetical protein